MANNASSVLAMARSQLGKTDGTKYGRWYAKQSGEAAYGALGVAWCAMFASWCFAQAGALCDGLPGAYCPTIYAKAKAANRVVGASSAKAGDVVLYDWDGGNPDHVGIVEAQLGTALQTIEGNVSGMVARRTRGYSCVKAIIRPNYDAEEDWMVYGFSLVKTGSSGNAVRLAQAALNIRNGAGLLVDGSCGPVTAQAIKNWQRKVGLYEDGICGPKTWPTLLGK